MPLTELLPSLRELFYSEKLLLLHFLAGELLKESGLTPLDAQGIVAMMVEAVLKAVSNSGVKPGLISRTATSRIAD